MFFRRGGTEVAGGKHVVPPGVAVEELDGGKKKLADECPVDLAMLLDEKKLRHVYDAMVEKIVSESKTRHLFGKWKDGEFIKIIDEFRDQFAEKGINVVLCHRASGSGHLRWLEFIDCDKAGDYVPQYDVTNMSGQIIKTIYTTLEFPNGVAVEEFKMWKGRKRLHAKIPTEVAKLMSDKSLMDEYGELVDACVSDGYGKHGWNIGKLNQVIRDFRDRFEAKGVSLFLAMKKEYVSHGQYGGHTEYFRWVEFVDREEQPNYYPQRDASGMVEDKCQIS